jgi:polyhydroxybutyrate depolymerase
VALLAAVASVSLIAASCDATSSSETATESTVASVAAPTQTTEPISAGCGRSAVETEPIRSTQVDMSVRSTGVDRTYKQYVPARYDAKPTPLIIDLHGYLSGAEGQTMMSDFGSFSENAGFVVATPQGNGPLPYWNAVPHADLPDDVQFVSDVIDDVSSRVCVDLARVYVAGLSNGAFLTSLIACRLADKVAAVATVAGLQLPEDCSPSRPIPILAIHGTADQFVTFDGSPNVALTSLPWDAESTRAFSGLPFAPVRDALGEWATINGCANAPREEPVSASVTVVRYDECRDGSSAELFIVDGGGHTWPGSAFSKASESFVGKTTDEINADEVIWEFFASHPMPTDH